MKILPCDNCKDGAMLKDGAPYEMGRTPHGGFPFRVYCARCKRSTMITVQRWNAIPDN